MLKIKSSVVASWRNSPFKWVCTLKTLSNLSAGTAIGPWSCQHGNFI